MGRTGMKNVSQNAENPQQQHHVFLLKSLLVGYKYVIPVSQVTKIIIRMNV